MQEERRYQGTISTDTATVRTLHDEFAPLVDSDLHLVNSAGLVRRARLVATDYGVESPGRESFSVEFEADDLTEGVYQVYHPDASGIRVGLKSTGRYRIK